jgi:hypothetical protein
MTTHLAAFFKKRRLGNRLSFGRLARLAGYRNISKSARHIQVFEQTGDVHSDLLAKLLAVLDVEEETVKRLREEDYREWNVRANQPVRPCLAVRLMAAVYATVPLPDDITSVP